MHTQHMVLAAGLLFAFGALAAHAREPSPSPYAGEERRAIKALSPEEVADLRAGAGMGFSKVAELNRYPGPRHVLELAHRLELSPAQQRDIQAIHAAMQREAQRLGGLIIDKEAELEALFAARRVDEARAAALLTEIGALRGQLRWVHVKAHLDTARRLSDAQIAAYDHARGYAGESGGAPSHRQHRH